MKFIPTTTTTTTTTITTTTTTTKTEQGILKTLCPKTRDFFPLEN